MQFLLLNASLPVMTQSQYTPTFHYQSVNNTQGTRGGPGGQDRTLAVKRSKNARNSSLKRNKFKKMIYYFRHSF